MPHVIVIEDDALVRKLLEQRLIAEGWVVTALRDARGLQGRLKHTAADLVVVDLGLPYLDGLTVVEQLRADGIEVPILVLTAYELPHLYATVRSTGANELMSKPYDQEDLVRRIQQLLAA